MHLRMAAPTYFHKVLRSIVFSVSIYVMNHKMPLTAANFTESLIGVFPIKDLPVMAPSILELMVFLSTLVSAASNAHLHGRVFFRTLLHDILAGVFFTALRAVVCLSCPEHKSGATAAAGKLFQPYHSSSSP